MDWGRVDVSPVTLLERVERSITTMTEEENDGSHRHGWFSASCMAFVPFPFLKLLRVIFPAKKLYI